MASLRQAKRRATKMGIPFDLTVDDIDAPTLCPALGIRLDYGPKQQGGEPNSPSLDRIIPSHGYTKENVQVISFLANRIKSSGESQQIQEVADWLRKQEGIEPKWHQVPINIPTSNLDIEDSLA